MRFSAIRGTIERRILVNYRADPAVLQALLPEPFRPKMLDGFGVAGICLIRLQHARPAGFPTWLGLNSENAAHRISVEWDDAGAVRHGVYILRRDTSSRLSALIGGRVFPGRLGHGRFLVSDADGRIRFSYCSDDDGASVSLSGRATNRWPGTSLFPSLTVASDFYQAGSLGYSATTDPGRNEGVELDCRNWQVAPLEIAELRSTFFEDSVRFPAGSIEFDSALVMRGIEHQWLGRPDVCCAMSDAPEPVCIE